MGQAGSTQQKRALRDVLLLRRSNVTKTELEEVLRTFCALFPLELQVPVNTDLNSVNNVIGVPIKERRLFDVVHGLLEDETEQLQYNNGRDMTELILTTFRRVIRWRELYKCCAKCSLKPFLTCLHRPSQILILSVLETLTLMMSPCSGFEAGDKAADRSETANRRNFGDAGGFQVLRSLLVQYGATEQQKEAPVILERVLKIFVLTLVSRRALTDLVTCTQAVSALMDARVALLALCHYPNSVHDVMILAIGLVRELFCIVDLDQVHQLQESAREYGALLYALETAVREDVDENATKNGKEVRDRSNVDFDTREMCIDLVEVFCAGNTCSKTVMYRIIPVELFIPAKNRVELIYRHKAASPSYAKAVPGARSVRTLPHFLFDYEQPRRTTIVNGNIETKRNRVVTLAYDAMSFGGGAFERWLGDAREKGEHWRELVEAVRRTYEGPELVWRASMRAELCVALKGEIEAFERRRRCMTGNETAQSEEQLPRWDHDMFYVEYPSMHKELVVNGYFVEYLIPCVADLTTACEIAEPVVLAWHLSDQLAVERDVKWATMCVRCLRLIIRRYAMLFHGQFPTQCVLLLLRDRMSHSPGFARESFLLLNIAITTARNTPSESFNRLCTTVARTVVDVLVDPVLLSAVSPPLHLDDEVDLHNSMCLAEPEDEAVAVVNECDRLVRAGISLLLAILRCAKFVMRFIHPKRMFLCRLLAVETLDHVTITRLLFLIKQLTLLDINGDSSILPESATISSRLSSASFSGSHANFATNSNWRSLTLAYALLASCDPKGMGMCVATAEFLQECCAQPPSCVSGGGSIDTQMMVSSCGFSTILNDALGSGGCGMGRLLHSTSAEVFTNTFNASQKRAADVKWGQKQRVRLYRYLKFKYLGYRERESTASWNSFVDDDFDHHYEDDDLFIGNIFLRSYIEGDGAFLNEWTPEMYSELINALFEELDAVVCRKPGYVSTRSVGLSPSPPQQPSLSQSSSSGSAYAAEPWEVQVLILKALARLVPSRCAQVKIKTEFYESLLTPLRRSMLSEVDQLRGILSLELFVSILSIPETSSVNTAACRLFLEERGLRALADSLERMRSPAYQHVLQTVEVFGPRQRSNPSAQNMARVLLYRLTDVLSIVAKQEATGIQAITKNPEVVIALVELVSRQIIVKYADVDAATVCLSCLGEFCHYDEARALVVNSGGMLSLLDIIAFCPAESQVTEEQSASDTSGAGDGQEESAKGEQTHDRKKIDIECNDISSSVEAVQTVPSRFFGAIRSAVLVLRACLGPEDAPAPSLPTQVLCQLLTPSFVRVLRTSPDQFILKLQTSKDINTATLVWTVSMRHRLEKCITSELAKVKVATAMKTWPRWNPDHFMAADSFRYQYPELSDVLVVHDIYLANFVATPVEILKLGDIDMASFSEALLISIQSHENVLRILRERGSRDVTKENAVQLMRQTLAKLVSKHPQHNLEVKTNCRLFPEDSLPVMSSTTATSELLPATLGAAATAVDSFLPQTNDRDWNLTRIERCSSSGIEDLTV
ncbi:hypothetical protein KXD40_004424 [Peronospora effusa]|nr:hypothetical protein KXD40_004424 [Peronospora effusa]